VLPAVVLRLVASAFAQLSRASTCAVVIHSSLPGQPKTSGGFSSAIPIASSVVCCCWTRPPPFNPRVIIEACNSLIELTT